jgi:CRP-like cAMP-binding protein
MEGLKSGSSRHVFSETARSSRTTLALHSPVMQRDFFAYCTSLRLMELKAIGALSQVRHFGKGDIIYSAGDEAKEFYIINRGAVEVFAEQAGPGATPTVLSRGEIFGAVEPLMDRPRDQTAKARAGLSVQCFRQSEFPDLLQRVPSFFLFLAEKLASHLFQANELVRSHHSALELTGSLANFDIVTVYQTILHSKQTGLLTITSGEGEKVSEFYFELGIPRWGRFEHLLGEEAFWQLFLHEDRAATFSFANGAEHGAPPVADSKITRQGDELLINAIQFRDEFEDLRKRLRNKSDTLRRKQLNFSWGNPELDYLRPVAEAIWQQAYSQRIALSELYETSDYSQVKLYKAVDEMIRAELFVLETPQPERRLTPNLIR